MNSQPQHLKRSLRHHAIVALLCGLLSYAVVYALRSSVLFDAAIDMVMRSQADEKIARPGPALTLFDVGDEDDARLGRPLVFPRDKLALLLARVAGARARMIVVDVDVSWPDAPERVKVLHAALTQLRKAGTPPVLLVREAFTTGEGSKLYLPQ